MAHLLWTLLQHGLSEGPAPAGGGALGPDSPLALMENVAVGCGCRCVSTPRPGVPAPARTPARVASADTDVRGAFAHTTWLNDDASQPTPYAPPHRSKGQSLLRALHVEGLPASMTAAELSQLFSPYGSVQYAEAAPDAVQAPSGELVRNLHCYVVFTEHAGACQARRLLSPAVDSSAAELVALPGGLHARFATPGSIVPLCTPALRAFVATQWAAAARAATESGTPGSAAGSGGKKASCKVNALFVSKLHQHVTTARLNALFGQYGSMIACEVQYHSDGRSAGHGVVIYETIEDAERALAGTNGYRLEGRALDVTPLRLKKLPSKLEHLKGRIKRVPAVGDGSGSDDGSCSLRSVCSPKSSLAGTPPAVRGRGPCGGGGGPAAANAAAAAAAAVALQSGLVHGLHAQAQAQQQLMMMQQLQHAAAMQQQLSLMTGGHHAAAPQVPCGMAAAVGPMGTMPVMHNGGLLPAAAGGHLGAPHSSAGGLPLHAGGSGPPAALPPHMMPPHSGSSMMARPASEMALQGLDLSFIA